MKVSVKAIGSAGMSVWRFEKVSAIAAASVLPLTLDRVVLEKLVEGTGGFF